MVVSGRAERARCRGALGRSTGAAPGAIEDARAAPATRADRAQTPTRSAAPRLPAQDVLHPIFQLQLSLLQGGLLRLVRVRRGSAARSGRAVVRRVRDAGWRAGGTPRRSAAVALRSSCEVCRHAPPPCEGLRALMETADSDARRANTVPRAHRDSRPVRYPDFRSASGQLFRHRISASSIGLRVVAACGRRRPRSRSARRGAGPARSSAAPRASRGARLAQRPSARTCVSSALPSPCRRHGGRRRGC